MGWLGAAGDVGHAVGMRYCPVCNKPPTVVEVGGRPRHVCMHCGWGRDRLAAQEQGGDSGRAAGVGVVRLTLGWLFSLGFVFGPCVAMLVYVVDVQVWMHVTYWAVMVTYLMGAAVLDPRPDTSNLGWAGGMIDNPFSWEDDHNRYQLGVMLLLIPGKVVAWTLVATASLLRGSTPE